jgi:signal transduction histidine kinase/ActR/RegA family two-component response regulator
MSARQAKPSAESSINRIALKALGMVLVIPALAVVYLFRDNMAGNELALGSLLVLSGLGFYLLWTIVRAIGVIQKGLESISRGETHSLVLEGGPAQLQEMTEIINALNRLTVEFRENATQLESFIQQFATLSELTEVTARVPDINELLRLVLTKVTLASQAKRGTILLLREGGDLLEIVAVEGWDPKSPEPIALHETLARKVIESGEPLLIEDIEEAIGIEQLNDASRYRSPSFLIMPLKTKTGVVGAVCLSEKATAGAFDRHDQQFLTVLLGQIGFAVENARLLKQAREAAQNLKRTVQHQQVQIQDAERQISQAEKLSALGQLAGGVAHDFNNLIQAILGYTKISQEGLSPEETRYRDLEEVRKAAEGAAALTNQLLAFGGRQLLERSDLDLNQVVHELVRMMNRVIGEHIELEILQGEDLKTVHADPRQLEQIVMNLCINARDAMPQGGTITIETRNAVLDAANCPNHPSARPGDYVLVRVSDVGHGMDEETRHQIFEPFFTTKEVGRGTGLGLATVHGIVEQHGGMIDVWSEPGEGTAFSIYLPAVDRPAAKVERQAEDFPSDGVETILVAEDEERVRKLTVRILERAGYTVLSAPDGEMAIRIFEANADRISLVLLDAVMPKMTGREVYRRIQSIKSDVGILLASGYSADADHTRFIQDEGLHFIQKPFDPDALLRKVREVIDASCKASP